MEDSKEELRSDFDNHEDILNLSEISSVTTCSTFNTANGSENNNKTFLNKKKANLDFIITNARSLAPKTNSL